MNFTDRIDGRRFDQDSLDLFLAVAPQLAVAIDRSIAQGQGRGEFEQLSVTDALTGLLNRRYIEARLVGGDQAVEPPWFSDELYECSTWIISSRTTTRLAILRVTRR